MRGSSIHPHMKMFHIQEYSGLYCISHFLMFRMVSYRYVKVVSATTDLKKKLNIEL